jgi:hypothetical protein
LACGLEFSVSRRITPLEEFSRQTGVVLFEKYHSRLANHLWRRSNSGEILIVIHSQAGNVFSLLKKISASERSTRLLE